MVFNFLHSLESILAFELLQIIRFVGSRYDGKGMVDVLSFKAGQLHGWHLASRCGEASLFKFGPELNLGWFFVLVAISVHSDSVKV